MKKKACLILTGAFALVNFFLFILYYISTYVFSGSAALYVYTFISEFVLFTMPLTVGAVFATVYANGGVKPTLLYSVPTAIVHIVYLFPLYAFEYAYLGYVITDVLLISGGMALFGIASFYIESMLLSLLIILITKAVAARRGMDYRAALREKCELFNLSAPASAGIFAGALALFIYKLVLEIVDTVTFIGASAGIMTAGEIVYITVRYLFLLCVLLGSWFVASAVKNRTVMCCDSVAT